MDAATSIFIRIVALCFLIKFHRQKTPSALGNNMQDCGSKSAHLFLLCFSAAHKEMLDVHYEKHTGAAHDLKAQIQ